MTKDIPINPSILKWARERAGFSIEELEKNFPYLHDWETGVSYPSYSQLERLTSKYKLTLAVLFFPQIPDEESIEKSLRAFSEEDLQLLSSRVRFLFRKGKAYQIYLRELLQDEKDKQSKRINWLKKGIDKSPKELADYVRDSLHVSLETQFSWGKADSALSEWREIFAKNGIYVFKEAFKDDTISGFCLYDDLYPIIFINNTHAKTRQIFTLFHELGHLLFRENYLDLLKNEQFDFNQNTNNEEVRCNAFAGHFLVPDESLKENFSNEDLISFLEEYSASYNVSHDVILRRLFELKKVTKKTYLKSMKALKIEYEKQNKTKKPSRRGGNYFSNTIQYVGFAYCSLVMQKYYQGIIGVEKASEYLDVKPKSFNGIESAFSRKGFPNVHF